MTKKKLRGKKKLMYEALKNQLGVVTAAAKQVGIERTTHYLWLRTDKNYREWVEDAKLVLKDFGENALFKLMKEGNTAAVIFFNKTRNKDRGYIEKSEIEHSGDSGITITTNIPNEVKELMNGNKLRPDSETGDSVHESD